MRATLLLRTLCVIVVAFTLVSAIPPAASGQAPEPPRPARMQGLADPRASRYPGELPQADSTVSPQAPEALADWSKIAFQRYFSSTNWETVSKPVKQIAAIAMPYIRFWAGGQFPAPNICWKRISG